MAVQFLCPSCQQPIEIDDNWAGQSVACPYCKRVVTAPRQSSWPPADVPMASPARSGFPSPPPPPPGFSASQSPVRAPTAGPSSAGWALVLAVSAGVLSVIGAMIWSFGLYSMAMNKVGRDASPELLQRTAQEIMLSGAAPVSPGATAILGVGIFCGIAALALALRSLVSNEGQPVKAVAACLISALFVVCQGMLVVVIFHRATTPG